MREERNRLTPQGCHGTPPVVGARTPGGWGARPRITRDLERTPRTGAWAGPPGRHNLRQPTWPRQGRRPCLAFAASGAGETQAGVRPTGSEPTEPAYLKQALCTAPLN